MIRIGPAGWAYKDWRGVVYPSPAPAAFDPVNYLARYFDTLEINVSFYRPLTTKETEAWTRRVEANPRFRFTAKLYRAFTHERAADVPAHETQQVLDSFSVLNSAHRLGAVLVQFPWSFRNNPENRDRISRLSDIFSAFPLVLEVRHGTWAQPGVLDYLDSRGIGLCNIDQPLFHSSIQPSALATSPLGYVRLHGRNYKSWFTENRYAGERYDYLYSVAEIEPWIDRIQAVAAHTRDTYVITNNHYLGKAVVNATEIIAILKGEPVPVPEALVHKYPELIPYALTENSPQQLPLL